MGSIDRFRDEVGAGTAARLDQVCFSLAAAFDCTVDVDAEVQRLDRVAERFDGDTSIELISWMATHGFRGNRSDYYSPDNSMLPLVMRTGLGIPITLSVMAIEIGRRNGLDLVGIGAPGEFLVGDADDREHLFNPFRGEVHPRSMVIAALSTQPLPPGVNAEALLAPVGPAEIAERMLNNLEQIMARRRNPFGLFTVARLRVALPTIDSAAQRRCAALAEECGAVAEGLSQIGAAIERRSPTDDVVTTRKDWLLLRRLQAHLN